jgi:predicted dehydrogenase
MLHAAIVGMGWWGKQIVTCLDASETIRIVRGVEVEPDKVAAFAAARGFPVTADLADALADDAVEAVILATPHALHEEQVLAAAAAGKQIFCEKPFALSADAAKRMLEACDRADLAVVGIGHERRFEGALEAVKAMLDDGRLGEIIHLECNWSHNNMTKSVASGWRRDPRQAPLGTLTAMGVHITDYFQSLVGPVASLRAVAADRSPKFPGNDVVSVQFRFESGVTGYMCNLAATPFYSRINVYGDAGWAEARENANVDVAEPATLTTRWLDEQLTTQTYRVADTVRANLEQWAGAAVGNGAYRFTRDQLLHNVQILEAIIRSAESGAEVAVRG